MSLQPASFWMGPAPETAGASSDVTQRIQMKLRELEALEHHLSGMNADPLEPPEGAILDTRLTVVIPAYNEAGTIEEVLRRVRELPVRELECIVVDDGSSDGTREILDGLRSDTVRVIFHEHNGGKGRALRTGFEQATGDVIAVQDADLEYHPRELTSLIRPLLRGDAEVVYGSRFMEEETAANSSFMHRFGNWLLTQASNTFTGYQLTDMETCYKVFNRDVLQSLIPSLKQDRFGFEPEVTAKLARAGYQIKELPIHYEARDFDEGKKIGYQDALEALWCIVRYWWSD